MGENENSTITQNLQEQNTAPSRAPRMPAKGPAAAAPRYGFAPPENRAGENQNSPATLPLRLALPPEVGQGDSLEESLPAARPAPAPQNPVLSATQGFKRVTAQMPAAKPVLPGTNPAPKTAGRVPGAARSAAGAKPAKKQSGKKSAQKKSRKNLPLPAVQPSAVSGLTGQIPAQRPNARAQAFAAERARIEKQRRKRKKIKRAVLICVIILVVLLAAFFALQHFGLINVNIKSFGSKNIASTYNTAKGSFFTKPFVHHFFYRSFILL